MSRRFNRQRVFIEIFVFLLIFLSFFRVFPEYLNDVPKRIQIIPVLIRIFSDISLLSIFTIISFLLLTLIFGRVYCSYICPLGACQDGLIRFWGKIRRKIKYKYNPPIKNLKFFIFSLSIISVISGSLYFVIWLDPYSFFGKIVTYVFKIPFIFLNNSLDLLLRKFDFYFISSLEYPKVHLLNLIPFILIIGLIIFFTMKRGRLYCNSICPLGTFLGIISTYSLIRLNIDSNCTSCGLCESVCKAECIDYKNKIVDESSCIRCFNCVSICPVSAINYVPYYKVERLRLDGEKKLGVSRRKFISYITSLIAFTGINLFARNNIETDEGVPPTPPGSGDLSRYIEKCTACYLCVNNCPTNVLQPSIIQYGIRGSFIPHMDYNSGFCEYECNICSNICPTGAILPISVEEKKEIQIGTSKLIKDICIVYSENSDCGACAEHCPTKAVHMVPYKGLLYAPEANNLICVGCGACEYACPTNPKKAIIVQTNKVHKRVEKGICLPPEEKKEELEIEEVEGFPF